MLDARAPLRLVYLLWATQLFDLHYFLGEMIAPPLGRFQSIVYVLFLGAALLNPPLQYVARRHWVWYPAFGLMVVAAAISTPGAPNIVMAWGGLKLLAMQYLLCVATALYVRTPMQAVPILTMVVWRFAWWAIWARGGGLVPWHPSLANYDGFGGLMVMGAALCFWFAMASPKGWKRWALFALAAYCVLGVVASMARGAFLALVGVGALIWLRSPRKGVTTLAIIAGAGVVYGAASVLFEPGFFYNEIMSSFTEGTETGTGGFRWNMWKAAFQVWQEHPIIGVGANNFGVFASGYFQPGEIEDFDNVGLFWGMNLHNAYVQILSEFGLVGVTAFLWIMYDFVSKTRKLHHRDAQARWTALGGDRYFQLRYLAYGIEGGLVGVLLGNMVYASYFESWFATLWALNRMLWAMTRPGDGVAPSGAKAAPKRRLIGARPARITAPRS
jgi:O-antigen ligase